MTWQSWLRSPLSKREAEATGRAVHYAVQEVATTPALLDFGSLPRRMRRAAHLAQAELAQRLGCSVVYISMLELGARHPQRTTLILPADPRPFRMQARSVG